MRKIGKSFLIVFVLLLSLAAAGMTALSFGIKLVDQSGWHQAQNGAVYYLDWEGTHQTGWKTVDGNLHYFDPDREGVMARGWQEIDDLWYYFDDAGVIHTGWLDLLGSRYYMLEHGPMASGWQTIEGKQYYFDQEGELQVGWLYLEDLRFYLGVDGAATYGWHDSNQGRCYLTQDGVVYTGWQYIDEQRFYFDVDGYLQYGWLELDHETYYLDSQGVMLTGWQDLDEGRYYLGQDGCLKTGWLNLDEGRYFLGTDGVLNTGWITVGGFRYYLSEDGLMQTGWLLHNGEKYYLRADGTMAVGEVEIDGTRNYFTSEGKYVILVNWENPVPDTYQPNLVEYQGYQIDKSCLDAFDQLLKACKAAGYQYSLNSVYRSWDDQQQIWDERMQQYMEAGSTEEEALALVAQSVAVPGTSEHHLGLAADVGGNAEMYTWMKDNCWKYGFIVRYPDGKTDYTAIIYEPWHIRYVGKELAQELHELDLCMEEYMEKLTK